jgi:mannose/fructose/N-acetylgalactosamine-specific phosphotransferase system component IIB
MATVKLVRVDFRLIHGQIITKWRKFFGINKIVVIDDILAADDFMIRVYTSAAPSDVTIKVYTEEKALRLWEKNKFGEGDALILFKDIATCYRMLKKGIQFEQVQLGGVPQTPEKKLIVKAVSLGESDIAMLRKMHDIYNVNLTIQIMPEDAKTEYFEIVKKYES